MNRPAERNRVYPRRIRLGGMRKDENSLDIRLSAVLPECADRFGPGAVGCGCRAHHAGETSGRLLVVGLFFFVYLFGWFYYAKWVYERQTEDVLIQSSLIGFSPNLVFGIVGLVYAVLVALLAGKPSTIFVYSLLSIASIMLAVAGLVAILLYKKQLDRKHTENFH
jgi:hypothetical protein